MEGGGGNDVLVWNNGDNSDTMDGDAGNDEIEVNGAVGAADTFTIAPGAAAGRVRFDRTNLVPFTLDVLAERMTVNGLGGAETMSGAADLAPRILLTLNGDDGADTITGGDGGDLITGGEEADTLAGAGGDDRVVGDRGNDVMSGGAGDDTLVWNNGDNNDRMDGEDGEDTVEVNGAVGAGDAFTLAPNGARAATTRSAPRAGRRRSSRRSSCTAARATTR
jgi:Ca2+-binding RTX toxin-like protein